jgi:hypothetical protein
MKAEVDTERQNSDQRTEKKEYQMKPHRASFFEFHVQDKRGSSAASFFSLRLNVVLPSKRLAPMGLFQFPVQSMEGITSRTAALAVPQESSQAAAWANHRAREGRATTGRSRLRRKASVAVRAL